MALLPRAPGFSACTSVVFLTSPVTACATDTRAGREGQGRGRGGNLGVTLETLGKGAPRGFPRRAEGSDAFDLDFYLTVLNVSC